MTDGQRLTIAFLESRPLEAAEVLEQLEPDNVAAFLAQAPVETAAPVLEEMQPPVAARCLAVMEPQSAARLTGAMQQSSAAAVLRAMPSDPQIQILERSSAAKARVLTKLISYPETTVGAWMEPGTTALAPDSTIGAALARAKKLGRRLDHHMFVTGAARKLIGVIGLPRLVAGPASALVIEYVDRNLQPVLDLQSLDTAANATGWDDYYILPVVDRGRRLVGALPRTRLRRGLQRMSPRANTVGTGSVVLDLAGAYILGLADLMQGMTASPIGIEEAARDD